MHAISCSLYFRCNVVHNYTTIFLVVSTYICTGQVQPSLNNRNVMATARTDMAGDIQSLFYMCSTRVNAGGLYIGN